MEDQERIQLLERIPVLENKTYDQLVVLNHFVDIVQYRKGRVIYSEGDPSTFIGFIVSGEVEINMGKGSSRTVFMKLRSKRGIGFSLLDAQPRPVTARALQDTIIVQLSTAKLKKLCKGYTALAVLIYADLFYFMVNVFREITTAIVDNINLIEYKTGLKFTDIVQNQFTVVYETEMYRRLGDQWLERLSQYMTLVTFKTGEVLFKEHDPSDFIGYVVEGRISFVKQRPGEDEVEIGELGKGMLVGSSIFDDYLRLATATALEPTTLFTISKVHLEKLKIEEPVLALELHRDASRFMMQVLRIFGEITARYLDVLPV
jgi:CRP-like cAMP-binding protein